jgi:hypothetical protein
VSDARRDFQAFARTVSALGPYLADRVFIGGWAHFLFTLRPEAAPLPFTPLTTRDADVAAPLRLARREQSIAQLLIAAGFEQRLSGDQIPPVSEYALGDEATGFYVEFLAPLVGGEVKRGGRADVTTIVGGVTAQTLRHLDILLMAPWQVTLASGSGFPVARPTVIQIPNPAAFMVQKILVLGKRMPAKQAKDLLYLHDTLSVFADALPKVRTEWASLKPQMVPAHVRTFENRARSIISQMSDVIRDAARIAADRPRPPTPEILIAGLRQGLAAAFDVHPEIGE